MKIIKLAVALLMTACVSPANATLIFDFSITDSGNSNLVVTGEILGLDDNATSHATSVRVLTNSAGDGIGEYVGDYAHVFDNKFTVSGGSIVDTNFNSVNYARAIDYFLDLRISHNAIFYRNSTEWVSGRLVTIKRVSVPEPGTVILLSLGIAGLSLSRYKKKY
ncbi:MAG: hypothetical protein ACI88A_002960 [Paraglaciecola sp.]|jgi:hypothetical protein